MRQEIFQGTFRVGQELVVSLMAFEDHAAEVEDGAAGMKIDHVTETEITLESMTGGISLAHHFERKGAANGVIEAIGVTAFVEEFEEGIFDSDEVDLQSIRDVLPYHRLHQMFPLLVQWLS
jgi:hypothetical protein